MLNGFFNYKNRITGEVISETEFWYGALLGKIRAENFEIILPDFLRESDPEQAAKSAPKTEPLYVNRFTGEVMTLDEAMAFVGERFRTFRKLFVPESEAGNVSGEELYLSKFTGRVGTLHDLCEPDMFEDEFFSLLDNLIPLENLPEFMNLENWMLFRCNNDGQLALACRVYPKSFKSAHWKIYTLDTDEFFWFGMCGIDGCDFTAARLIDEMADVKYEYIKTIPTEIGSEHKPSEMRDLLEKLQAAYRLLHKYDLI